MGQKADALIFDADRQRKLQTIYYIGAFKMNNPNDAMTMVDGDGELLQINSYP